MLLASRLLGDQFDRDDSAERKTLVAILVLTRNWLFTCSHEALEHFGEFGLKSSQDVTTFSSTQRHVSSHSMF